MKQPENRSEQPRATIPVGSSDVLGIWGWLKYKPHNKAMPVWQLLLCLLPLVAGNVFALIIGNDPIGVISSLVSLCLYYANKSWHLKDA